MVTSPFEKESLTGLELASPGITKHIQAFLHGFYGGIKFKSFVWLFTLGLRFLVASDIIHV